MLRFSRSLPEPKLHHRWSVLGANSAGSMSATDLASSYLSNDGADADLYEPAASTLGSRYKRVARSKSSVSAFDSHSSSTLKVVKLEVKAPTAGRSGLLAAQLKGYACQLASCGLHQLPWRSRHLHHLSCCLQVTFTVKSFPTVS